MADLIVPGGIGGGLITRPSYGGGGGGDSYPSWMEALYVAAEITNPADLNGSGVAVWRDLTGNGHDLTQSTGSKQPTLTTTDGRPVVRFDGTDDIMFSDSFTLTQEFTIITVVQGLASWNIFDAMFAGSGFSLCGYPISAHWSMYAGSLPYGLYANISEGPVGPKIIRDNYNGPSSRIALNSGAYSSFYNPGTGGTTNGFSIGGYQDENPSYFSNLEFQVISIIDNTMTSDDETWFTGFLTSNFGVV